MKLERDLRPRIRGSLIFGRRILFPRTPLFLIAFLCFTTVCMATLHAEESPLSKVLDSSNALVDVLSVNVTMFADTPQGFIDKSTGQAVVTRRMAPATYTRNGSGVVIDPRGIIVTNAHTVRDAGAMIVTFLNGMRASVNEVCMVTGTDLALLIIDPPFALSAVRLGDADVLSAGNSVYTVGHSEWLNGSVIGGRILGVQREGNSKTGSVTAIMLNFDMAQGDSGCPILNARGELMGIVSAGKPGRNAVTIAIPSNGIATAYKEYLRRKEKK